MLDYLFVYGSLRRAKNHSLHPYLNTHAVFIDRATLPGKLYHIASYPGAIPVHANDKSWIRGEVYRLLRPKLMLPILDHYEECTPQFPQPHEYQRRMSPVTLENGKILSAWVYWYGRPVAGLTQIATGDYFQYLPETHAPKPK